MGTVSGFGNKRSGQQTTLQALPAADAEASRGASAEDLPLAGVECVPRSHETEAGRTCGGAVGWKEGRGGRGHLGKLLQLPPQPLLLEEGAVGDGAGRQRHQVGDDRLAVEARHRGAPPHVPHPLVVRVPPVAPQVLHPEGQLQEVACTRAGDALQVSPAATQLSSTAPEATPNS